MLKEIFGSTPAYILNSHGALSKCWFNFFTTTNERNHKMTQIFVKYIQHLCIFRHLKLEIALAIPASNDEK